MLMYIWYGGLVNTDEGSAGKKEDCQSGANKCVL